MNKKEFLENCDVNKRRVDRYDYEANCSGCRVVDYDKYRRNQIQNNMLLFGVLCIYFMIGLVVGIILVAQALN